MKSYQDLLADLEKIKIDIDLVRESEARLLAGRVLALLKESGIDLPAILDVADLDRKEVKRKIKPKYWNPATGATWSGRGRTPRWLVGKNFDDYVIKSTDET
ncbi:H-NS histone family protein [Burkholderia arboris]|uniref:H-NS histone family protein n=1 Tax=Burkholderia arboris TaxID=488730 RepID=UPI001CF51D49|nr:H-NS histone family protein [Burkholderia arboris]MCA8052817.1 H-NS histone family protein [Burkholderia arboris]